MNIGKNQNCLLHWPMRELITFYQHNFRPCKPVTVTHLMYSVLYVVMRNWIWGGQSSWALSGKGKYLYSREDVYDLKEVWSLISYWQNTYFFKKISLSCTLVIWLYNFFLAKENTFLHFKLIRSCEMFMLRDCSITEVYLC